MAAVVAGPEPEMAPKNIQATTVAVPRPPVVWPMSLLATLTSRLDNPPVSIREPASMKQGMATRGRDSKPEYICWAMKDREVMLKPPMTVAIMPKPRAMPTGTPMARSTTATNANTAIAILTHLPFRRSLPPAWPAWRPARPPLSSRRWGRPGNPSPAGYSPE